MLQNRYGDREFPVRDRWRYARLAREAARRQDPSRAALRGLIWMAPAILVLVAIVPGVVSDDAAASPADASFLGALGVFVLVAAAGLIVGALVDRSIPRREQQRYRRLVGDQEVTERQQQLLALDAQSDYAIGGWNSSLDYGPAWSMMPADMRKRHEQSAKRSFFVTMPLFEERALRARLDADEHIASGGDVELFVADALSDASLSGRFHRVLHGADGERMLARVASLTGVGQWDLRALDEAVDGRSARLLWAADTQRVIAVLRMAYLAGHIDAATTWRLIERAAEPASALFTGWDDYWADVRIGLAFLTDRLEVVQQMDDSLAGLRGSDWPAAHVPFPTGAAPAWLPVFRAGSPSTADDQP